MIQVKLQPFESNKRPIKTLMYTRKCETKLVKILFNDVLSKLPPDGGYGNFAVIEDMLETLLETASKRHKLKPVSYKPTQLNGVIVLSIRIIHSPSLSAMRTKGADFTHWYDYRYALEIV